MIEAAPRSKTEVEARSMISTFLVACTPRAQFVVASLLPLALSACGAGQSPGTTPHDVVPQHPGTDRYVYICPDGLRFSAQYQEDSVVLTLPDQELRLPRAVSASGARYASGDTVFWGKGDEARLEIPAGEHTECVAHPVYSPWEEAGLLGYTFRGIGQEPGWSIEIRPGDHTRLVLDYGERTLRLPAPEPVRSADGVLTYEMRAADHTVAVRIEEEPCRDAMSGEPFTHTVSVTVDGREYQGCGRELIANSPLIGTRWALIHIDGRPATAGPGGEAPYIQLLDDEDRVTGNTGCNLINGGYVTDGDRLTFTQLATTRRACVEPDLMQQEQRFTHMLEATDRYVIRAGVLTLYQGTTALARFAAERGE